MLIFNGRRSEAYLWIIFLVILPIFILFISIVIPDYNSLFDKVSIFTKIFMLAGLFPCFYVGLFFAGFRGTTVIIQKNCLIVKEWYGKTHNREINMPIYIDFNVHSRINGKQLSSLPPLVSDTAILHDSKGSQLYLQLSNEIDLIELKEEIEMLLKPQ